MGLTSWLRNRLGSRATRPQPRPASRFRPQLETLEDRTVPSTLTVTTAADVVDANDGVLSLREAINAADPSGGNTIDFDSSLSGKTIQLDSTLRIETDLSIQGLGAEKLAVSGGQLYRVFWIDPGANVTLSGLTITGGNAWLDGLDPLWSDFKGGGILNLGTLTIDACNVTGNKAGWR